MRSLLLLPQYIQWHYLDAPKSIIAIVKNLLWFSWHLFSIESLLLTLFSPWERLQEKKPRRFNFNEYFEATVLNGIMRATGAIIRLAFIAIGLIMIALVAVSGFVFFVIWLVLPLVVAGVMILGIILIVKPI